MLILGINSVYHESSACLLKKGQIVAFAEEERFNRIKHAKYALPHTPEELPNESIHFCLNKGGVDISQVDAIAYSFNPEKRKNIKWPKEEFLPNCWGSQQAEEVFISSLRNVETKLRNSGFTGKFFWIDHQIAHGASAYFYSPYDEAAILSIDGIGEIDSTALLHGKNECISTIQTHHYPNSLGFLWEKLCKFLGFSEYHACKVMGLSAYGNKDVFKKQFDLLVSIENDGGFKVNNELLKFRSDDFKPLEDLFKTGRRLRHEPLREIHNNIAAALQDITNDVIMNIADNLYAITGSDNLCYAGGVALNCISNSYLAKKSSFKNIFIQPSANDAGTALGAAAFVWHTLLGNKRSINAGYHPYHGPSFSEKDYIDTIENHGLHYERHNNIEEVAAKLIYDGCIVGWFQDSMESGPRALGNRSLLADPRKADIRGILNVKVKHRELFRPFAPSILDEFAEEWFVVKPDNSPNDFMLMVDSAAPKKASLIPSVIHVDGTARIQRVKQNVNPKYHKLIKCFYELSGVPMILNTSFNDDEPIVCTPQDAIHTFKKTAIDYVILGNYLVKRNI